MNANWIKCAAVWSGAKAHFWKHRTRPLWVVWNRKHGQWAVESYGSRIIALHATETAAIKAAESLP